LPFIKKSRLSHKHKRSPEEWVSVAVSCPNSLKLFKSRLQDELKSKKELKYKLGKNKLEKGEKNSLIWRKDIKSKKSGIDVTLFGYIAHIVKHGESDRLMKIDFYSREPFKVNYQLLEGK
jgi:hypothetical protein